MYLVCRNIPRKHRVCQTNVLVLDTLYSKTELAKHVTSKSVDIDHKYCQTIMCFVCVEDEIEQLAISYRVLVSKGSECCATSMLNSQPFVVVDADEDDLCHSLVDNSETLSANKATFNEPRCKADASVNEEEGLDECGVFAIPNYQLSQPRSANEELQSLTMCLCNEICSNELT